jgi:hypothetical protein
VPSHFICCLYSYIHAIHYLSQDLETVLGPKNKHLIREMFDELGVDKDGEISYEAFLSLFEVKQINEIDKELDEIQFVDESDSEMLMDETASIPGGKFQNIDESINNGVASTAVPGGRIQKFPTPGIAGLDTSEGAGDLRML